LTALDQLAWLLAISYSDGSVLPLPAWRVEVHINQTLLMTASVLPRIECRRSGWILNLSLDASADIKLVLAIVEKEPKTAF
jgi:hypothetical protein